MEIGIIGTGAAGVSLLDALSHLAPTSASAAAPGGLTVFDGAPQPWRGRAYQSDLEAVLVNAPPVLMSIRHGDPEHYLRWLAEQEPRHPADPWLGVPLVPRAVYGDYLEATAHEAIARLRRGGWRVEVVEDWVTGVAPLRTSGGTTRAVDHTVLGVGGGSPRDQFRLSGQPGFVLEPYPLARTLAGVPADARVAVIGSGLTAVDIVAALVARGHAGPITLLSRQGLLPDVQQRLTRLELRHLTPENLPGSFAGMVALMEAELAEHGQGIGPLVEEVTMPEHPVKRLERQLAEVDAPYMGRRLLVAAVHMLGTPAWRRLPPDERTMLRTTHLRTVTRMASPMIPGNADILRQLFDSGQLGLQAATPRIVPRGGGFRIRGLDEGAGDLVADVVVNAVNPPAHAIPQDSVLLADALRVAGAVSLPADGGLAVQSDDVHVVGAVAADTSFVTPSVPALAAQAQAVAARILSG
jgi:uncharacterized NAD(P)/FAD-binding protein YdhS